MPLLTTRETRDHIRKTADELAAAQDIPPERFPGHKGAYCANLEGYLGRFARALADDVDTLLGWPPATPTRRPRLPHRANDLLWRARLAWAAAVGEWRRW